MDETAQILADGEHARRLKESEDWKWAKQKLEFMLTAVNSLETLPTNVDATSLQEEIGIRKKTIAIIHSWIEEVEGDGIQRQFAAEEKLTNDELVTRFGEEDE